MEVARGETGPDAMDLTPEGFGRSSQHVLMLEDRMRTSAFLQAVRETVRPGDVVVDIGTGTGVLAIAAALAGAEHVYAIEMTAMADVARRGVEANGLSDRITVVQGRSTEITLPRRADVVVSETIGDDLFDESILPTLHDAADRLATPGARFLPHALRPVIVPVRIDDEIWRRRFYAEDLLAGWSADYGIDFSWLGAETRTTERFPRGRAYVAQAPRIDLPPARFPGAGPTYDETVRWTAESPLQVNALLLGFVAEIGSTSLTNLTADRSSWELPADVLPRSMALEPGDQVEVRVRWLDGLTQIAWERSA